MAFFFDQYTDLASYLDGKGLFRITPGLERIQAVLSSLDLIRPPFVVVQVAGTNGKGSTSTALAALAQAHGLCVGLYTSPHLVCCRERVRINGEMLSEERWVELANTLMRHGADSLSYFELVTALAIVAFAEANVDIAVLETGLGGTWDATTVVSADLVLYTPIAFDHMAILGSTLQAIASDKAGAMRRGIPAISAPQQKESLRELIRVAQERNAPFCCLMAAELARDVIDDNVEQMSAPLYCSPPAWNSSAVTSYFRLQGEHQFINASLALAGWRYIQSAYATAKGMRSVREGGGVQHDSEMFSQALAGETLSFAEQQGLAVAWLPGRMQWVPPSKSQHVPSLCPPHGWPPLLIDGAHNAHGLAALGLSLAKRGIAPLAVIFSCLQDKDLEQIIPHVRAFSTGPVFVPPIQGNSRAMNPVELAACIGLNAYPVASLREALLLATQSMAERMPEVMQQEESKYPLLVCGSLYLLGEFFSLRPDLLE